MDLSPNDIRNYEFPHQMRGYDREEVDSFLEQVAEALEAVKQENLKLSMEIDSVKTQLAGLRQFEDTIKSAAIDARHNADMTVANAKKEAGLLLSRAKVEAEQIVVSHTHKVSELEEQIAKLELNKKSYLSKLRNLIRSHLQVLDEVASGEATSEAKNSLEVTESTEVTCKKYETIATKPQKAKPIKTEEANAAEKIVPVSPEAEQAQPSTAATADAMVGQQECPGESLDPELAAALESYQRKEAPAPEQERSPTHKGEGVPAPGQLVETSARAEDIPPGFIAKVEHKPTSEITDKIPAPTESQPSPAEHSPIDIDTAAESKENDSSMAPEKLAKELDRVAAKFEEEMDKAEKA